MLARIIRALALGAILGGSAWASTAPPHGARARTVCAAHTPVRFPSGVSLVVAVPTRPRDLYTRDGAVQLCRIAATSVISPLYHLLPTNDIAVSTGGRELAYGDSAYRIHLARLPDGADHVLGRGALPRFSFDGRYLAFVTSDTLPLPTSAERLMVYDLATGTVLRAGPLVLPRVGGGFSGPSTLYAWAPGADTLAWQPNPGQPKVAVVSMNHKAARTVTLPNGGISSELAWSPDGRSLLSWRYVGPGPTAGNQTPRYSLLRLPLPNGPTQTVVASVPTVWSEGIALAPVPNAAGTLFASLLGTPQGGLNQVVLYAHDRQPRSIPLPGEPRQVRFAPAGTQFVTIWTPPYNQGVVSHAALVDAATGRARDLGPAMGAFWTTTRPERASGSTVSRPMADVAAGTGKGGAEF